jgi:hypothetical protein
MPAMDALSPFLKSQQQKEDQRKMDRIGMVLELRSQCPVPIHEQDMSRQAASLLH